MLTLKEAKEKRADIVNKMEALNNSSDTLNEQAQKDWDGYVNEVKQLEHFINRQEFIKSQRAAELDSAAELRNDFDGESKEIEKYSFREALAQVSSGRIDGIYAEMSEEGRRELREAGASPEGGQNSLIIPFNVLKNKRFTNAMTATVAADGGNAVATELRSFVDHLYDSMVTVGLGAEMLTGLSGNIDFPTESTVASFAWAANEATAEVSESEPKVGKVSLSPKRGGTFVDVSNRLLLQTSPSIDARIERQILTAAQIGLEAAGIAGTGSNGQPEGILSTTGIGAAWAGDAVDNDANANGAALKREDIINLEKLVAVENADIGSLGYLTNAKVRAALKSTKVDAGSGLFVWPFNGSELNGYTAAVTNLVPSNIEKGNDSALSALIFGNFNDLVYGMWGGLEVLVDPYTQARKGITRMVLNMYADVAILRAKSFAAIKDAKA